MIKWKKRKTRIKKIIYSIIAVAILVVVVIGGSIAYFSALANTNTQTVTTANMELAFNDGTAIVNASNITPISQADIQTKAAKKSFSVTNNGTDDIYLQMKLTDITMPTELKSVWFRFALFEEGTRIALGEFSNTTTERFMQQNMTLAQGETKNYDLYIWIEESGEDQNTMQGKTFSGKVTVNASMTEYDYKIKYAMGNDQSVSGIDDPIDYYKLANITTLNIDKNNYDNDIYDLNEFTNLSTITQSDGDAFINVGSIKFPISLSTFGEKAFQCALLSGELHLKYLTNLTKIENYAFSYGDLSTCYDGRLSNILLPSSVTSIGNNAFKQAIKNPGSGKTLTIDFSNLINLTNIGNNVFSGLSSSVTVILPASIKDTVTIGSGAFGSATIVYQ